jgi:riboflavin kinase/FMN adenylyltransferase
VKVLKGNPRLWEPAPPRGSAVTIGVYDGVHRGHQTVLSDLAQRAEALGVAQRAVLTFDRHPLSLVAPERVPRLLTTIEQRLEILESLGVDLVGILPFDEIRDMDAKDFVDQVLLRALGAKLVVIGTNFRFGRDRAGDVAALRKQGTHHGFEVDAVELLRGDGATVSSSAIRSLLAVGDVEGAEHALGRPFELRGLVVAGDGRGRALGFPTANLSFSKELAVPAVGVYAVWVNVGGRSIPGVANVGVRPTFGGEVLTVEAHLMGFEDDLYGQTLAVEFKYRLRDELRFSGVDELAIQISRDAGEASRRLQRRD